MKQATKAVVDRIFQGCAVDSDLVSEIDDLLTSMQWQYLGQKSQDKCLNTLRSNFNQRKAYEAIRSSKASP